MDDQKQNTNNEEQPASDQVGQPPIQPTPTPPEEIKPQQPAAESSPTNEASVVSQPTTVPSTDKQAPIQQQSGNVEPPVISGGEVPIGKPFTPVSQVDKSKKGAKLLIALAVTIVIVIILVGTFYLLSKKKTEQPIKSDNTFSKYIFTNNDGDNYQVSFYKNSTTEQYSFGSVTDKVLISPPLTSNSVPILMTISGRQGNANANAQSDVAKSNSCSMSGQTEAFKVYIKSLSVDANFCTIYSGVGYESFFGNSSSVYFMQIIPATNNLAQTTANAQRVIRSNPSSSDVKIMAQSFKYISSK